MCPDPLAVTAQRHVHQLAIVTQLLKQGRHRALEAVPLQAELLRVHRLQWKEAASELNVIFLLTAV